MNLFLQILVLGVAFWDTSGLPIGESLRNTPHTLTNAFRLRESEQHDGPPLPCGSHRTLWEGDIFYFRNIVQRLPRNVYWPPPHPGPYRYPGATPPRAPPYVGPHFYNPHPYYIPYAPPPRPRPNHYIKPRICEWTFEAAGSCQLVVDFDHFEGGDMNCNRQYLLLADEERDIQVCGFTQLPGIFKSFGKNLQIKHFRKPQTWSVDFEGFVTCIKHRSVPKVIEFPPTSFEFEFTNQNTSSEENPVTLTEIQSENQTPELHSLEEPVKATEKDSAEGDFFIFFPSEPETGPAENKNAASEEEKLGEEILKHILDFSHGPNESDEQLPIPFESSNKVQTGDYQHTGDFVAQSDAKDTDQVETAGTTLDKGSENQDQETEVVLNFDKDPIQEQLQTVSFPETGEEKSSEAQTEEDIYVSLQPPTGEIDFDGVDQQAENEEIPEFLFLPYESTEPNPFAGEEFDTISNEEIEFKYPKELEPSILPKESPHQNDFAEDDLGLATNSKNTKTEHHETPRLPESSKDAVPDSVEPNAAAVGEPEQYENVYNPDDLPPPIHVVELTEPSTSTVNENEAPILFEENPYVSENSRTEDNLEAHPQQVESSEIENSGNLDFPSTQPTSLPEDGESPGDLTSPVEQFIPDTVVTHQEEVENVPDYGYLMHPSVVTYLNHDDGSTDAVAFQPEETVQYDTKNQEVKVGSEINNDILLTLSTIQSQESSAPYSLPNPESGLEEKVEKEELEAIGSQTENESLNTDDWHIPSAVSEDESYLQGLEIDTNANEESLTFLDDQEIGVDKNDGVDRHDAEDSVVYPAIPNELPEVQTKPEASDDSLSNTNAEFGENEDQLVEAYQEGESNVSGGGGESEARTDDTVVPFQESQSIVKHETVEQIYPEQLDSHDAYDAAYEKAAKSTPSAIEDEILATPRPELVQEDETAFLPKYPVPEEDYESNPSVITVIPKPNPEISEGDINVLPVYPNTESDTEINESDTTVGKNDIIAGKDDTTPVLEYSKPELNSELTEVDTVVLPKYSKSEPVETITEDNSNGQLEHSYPESPIEITDDNTAEMPNHSLPLPDPRENGEDIGAVLEYSTPEPDSEIRETETVVPEHLNPESVPEISDYNTPVVPDYSKPEAGLETEVDTAVVPDYPEIEPDHDDILAVPAASEIETDHDDIPSVPDASEIETDHDDIPAVPDASEIEPYHDDIPAVPDASEIEPYHDEIPVVPEYLKPEPDSEITKDETAAIPIKSIPESAQETANENTVTDDTAYDPTNPNVVSEAYPSTGESYLPKVQEESQAPEQIAEAAELSPKSYVDKATQTDVSYPIRVEPLPVDDKELDPEETTSGSALTGQEAQYGDNTLLTSVGNEPIHLAERAVGQNSSPDADLDTVAVETAAVSG